MINFFKPKKVYCVRFMYTRDGSVYQDLVSAVDTAQAWNLAQHRNSGPKICLSVVEVKDKDFKED